jgi:hypothetical protein
MPIYLLKDIVQLKRSCRCAVAKFDEIFQEAMFIFGNLLYPHERAT